MCKLAPVYFLKKNGACQCKRCCYDQCGTIYCQSVVRRWSLYWYESLSPSQINLIHFMFLCICLSFVKQVHVLL